MTSTGLPTLTTRRLTLRPAIDADREGLWQLLTDPQVRRYLCDDKVLTHAEVQEMLATSMAQWPAGMGLWILGESRGETLGYVGLHPVTAGIVAHAPDLAGEVEPTIALTPDHWGRGYTAEALAAAIAHAFGPSGSSVWSPWWMSRTHARIG